MTGWDWLFWIACGLIFAVSTGVIVGHLIAQGGLP